MLNVERKGKEKKRASKSQTASVQSIQTFFQTANQISEKPLKQKPPINRSPPTPVDELQAQKKSKIHNSADSSSSDENIDDSYDDSSGSESQLSQDTATVK